MAKHNPFCTAEWARTAASNQPKTTHNAEHGEMLIGAQRRLDQNNSPRAEQSITGHLSGRTAAIPLGCDR